MQLICGRSNSDFFPYHKRLGNTDLRAAQTPWVPYHSSVPPVQSTWLGSVSVLMRSRCHCPPGGTSQNHWSSAHCSLPQGSCEQPDLCKILRNTVIPPHKQCNTWTLSSIHTCQQNHLWENWSKLVSNQKARKVNFCQQNDCEGLEQAV